MRQPLVFFFLLFVVALPAWAQTAGDASLFEVPDVAVDITADSAAHARDQAIAQAQRTAFEQLLARLGADSALAAKVNDDTVSSLVQNFEVQNERTSSVRYIGIFTVQFRPMATRDWLNQSGVTFTEEHSKPLIVLPIYVSANGHPVLWEEHTKWRAAWDGFRNTGLVPLIVPNGGLDDIAVLSTEEAASGDIEALKNMADKYQADGAVVVSLEGDLDNPGPPFKIEISRTNVDGSTEDPVFITLPPAGDKNAIPATLAQAVRQVRDVLEGDWRSAAKVSQGPAARLAVMVPVTTLDEWATIRRKLGSVRAIDRTDVITLARGGTNIELAYHGDLDALREELSRQNLALTQGSMSGIWVLQLTAGAPL